MWLMPNSSANCRAERWSVRIARICSAVNNRRRCSAATKFALQPHGFHMLAATLNEFVA